MSMEIVLASASPRRRELMKHVATDFRVEPVDVDESSVRETDPVRFALEAAILKVKKGAESFPSSIIIGADTVVALGPRILGKPDSRDSARAMLRHLSGRRHRVITGVAFYEKREDRLLTGYELTFVTFRELTDEMIESYLERNNFHDKAGAYAVQDVGDAFVRRLKGDYDNVVGFPVKRIKRLLSFFERPPLTVRIEDSAFPESSGVVLSGGRRILIPGGITGDRARIQVVQEVGDSAEGEILRLLEPSPFRISPECPHFGSCGGCLFQNLDYHHQLELKARHLSRILDEGAIPGWGSDMIRPIVPSPETYFYRNKMEFGFGERSGETVLGLRERNLGRRRAWGQTVPLDKCPISSPIVESLFPLILDFARSNDLSPYQPWSRKGILRHLILRQAQRTGELMLVLVSTEVFKADFVELGEKIYAEIPRLKSFSHVVNTRISDVVDFERIRLLTGRPFIEEKLDGLTFRIRPEIFFQTNTAAAEHLYRRIRESDLITPESRVLGLYCGSGPIEISLAGTVKTVTGIDSLPANILSAEENREINGISNVSFLTGTVEKLLKNPPAEPWDVVIVDPPRAGISAKGLSRLIGLDIPALIYVSCNAKTLARDLKLLAAAGYRIDSTEPFDFFPHTPHLEILTFLHKD